MESGAGDEFLMVTSSWGEDSVSSEASVAAGGCGVLSSAAPSAGSDSISSVLSAGWVVADGSSTFV